MKYCVPGCLSAEIEPMFSAAAVMVAPKAGETCCRHFRCVSASSQTHQYFVVDTLCKWQPLEDLAEQLEHLGCVLGLHLPFKSVHLVHVVRLMVT